MHIAQGCSGGEEATMSLFEKASNDRLRQGVIVVAVLTCICTWSCPWWQRLESYCLLTVSIRSREQRPRRTLSRHRATWAQVRPIDLTWRWREALKKIVGPHRAHVGYRARWRWTLAVLRWRPQVTGNSRISKSSFRCYPVGRHRDGVTTRTAQCSLRRTHSGVGIACAGCHSLRTANRGHISTRSLWQGSHEPSLGNWRSLIVSSVACGWMCLLCISEWVWLLWITDCTSCLTTHRRPPHTSPRLADERLTSTTRLIVWHAVVKHFSEPRFVRRSSS